MSPARRALIAAVLCAGLTSPQARAQDAKPAAQALYDQATTEMDAGKFESACKKLEEVIRLVPDGIGAKMTLAQCYEGMGRLASAWSQYTQVENLARKTKQAGRATKAAQKAAGLKRKLASLTIDIPKAARDVPGLEVSRDGEAVGQAQWGLALPVDKGTHTVTAKAAGYKAWSSSIDVPDDGKSVTAAVPVLEKEPAPAPIVTSSPTATAAASAPAPVTTAPPPARTWQTPLGAVVLAAGVAGLGAGGAFAGLALVRRDESVKAGCNSLNQCPAAATPVRNEARMFGDISTAAIIAGGVLAAAGVVLLITAPRRSDKEAPSAKKALLSVEIAPSLGGAVIEGAF